MSASELADWQAAWDVLIEEKGEAYAFALLNQLTGQYSWNSSCPHFDIEVEQVKRASEIIRWNAMVMVVHANRVAKELGGHISSYASSSILYEVGFHYFFKGWSESLGDLVLFQGHISPGIYARSYLLGEFQEHQLAHFRQEVKGQGLSSYPHPWLMPHYWQFPTVSMGLGPLQGIYQAKLMKYLEARALLEKSDRKVWVFCGDGEMDEVDSLGALGVASREGLDNLIFVINCNLVRLDGPCRGNGQILVELASYFQGFGWEVIKVVWSKPWLDLVEKDHSGYLKQALMALKDGALQQLLVDQAALKEWFLSRPETKVLVESFQDEDFAALIPGGHDIQLVANAYAQAIQSKKPCCLLFLTEKGFGVPGVSGKNTSHNQKTLTDDQIEVYRQFLKIPKQSSLLVYYDGGDELDYMRKRHKIMGGKLPFRHQVARDCKVPNLTHFKSVLEGSGDREISTTMVFVRVLNLMLRDPQIKDLVVPILADEGRTFGMEGLFRQIGIYAPFGQQYTPHDRQEISYYKESESGQLIQEGINEAGAISMWLAAATAYSNHQLPLIPIYTFYSMFGFQRIGDHIWAAADSRARGFLMGATAGRTTLGGEGLQHNDGSSLLMAAMIPNCRSYDPCYGYELAVIMADAMDQMYARQKDVFYYITLMNENYVHHTMPEGVEAGIIQGMYPLVKHDDAIIDLMASGTILRLMEVCAEKLLEHNILVNVWSVTSWSELQKEALIAKENQQESYVSQCLTDQSQLVIAASDYVRALPGLLHEAIARPFVTIGTDGFGMSDTRQQLRDYFGLSEQKMMATIVWSMVDCSLLDEAKALKISKRPACYCPLTDDRRSYE